MRIIFSESDDFSTNKVIDWLIFYGKEYIRYNGPPNNYKEFSFNNSIISLNLNDVSNKFEIIHENNQLTGNNIESVWYRRPYKGTKDFPSKFLEKICELENEEIESILRFHYKNLKELLSDLFSKRVTLGSYHTTSMNKPIVLLLAQKCGLETPKTLITNSFDKLKEFYLMNNNKIICKALFENIISYDRNNNSAFIEYTKLIDDIDIIPKEFEVSIFQECIVKEFEIRVVFLAGKFFAMCIFSQTNKQTQIDFRKYDDEMPNRMVPYRLSKSLKLKMIKLMKELKLNMGSIDLIKSINGKYYFLEINPVGQYDFVSYHCNYNIHKVIAKYLSDENKKN